ncbi:MAG: pyridoxamine 5'-phosphate oxidase family protein [Burkholderiales bacterium]|jgi:general stress protein 26|nr:pyridoxamine 5'-phosphate oxidase family protein [Burkholderiales bacterium]
MRERPAWIDDLAATRAHVWRQLERAVHDRHAQWRAPVLATVGRDGAPHARTVILRGADAAASRLWLHTDARSAKVDDLVRAARASLVFYDRRSELQARVDGDVTVLRDGLEVDAAWARLGDGAKRNYRTALAPGTPAPSPDAAAAGTGPAPAPSEHGRTHFAVMRVDVRCIETLLLHPDGHRRARFARDASTWCVP